MLVKGDIIYLDPFAIPELKIISKEKADKIAAASPQHQFVITSIGKPIFKSFTEYVKKVKR